MIGDRAWTMSLALFLWSVSKQKKRKKKQDRWKHWRETLVEFYVLGSFRKQVVIGKSPLTLELLSTNHVLHGKTCQGYIVNLALSLCSKVNYDQISPDLNNCRSFVMRKKRLTASTLFSKVFRIKKLYINIWNQKFDIGRFL